MARAAFQLKSTNSPSFRHLGSSPIRETSPESEKMDEVYDEGIVASAPIGANASLVNAAQAGNESVLDIDFGVDGKINFKSDKSGGGGGGRDRRNKRRWKSARGRNARNNQKSEAEFFGSKSKKST